MSDHAKLKELADAATKGQWTCTSRPYGPFWQISSDHTVDGKDLQGASRQAIASYHAASKKNQPAYAAMFEANAKFAAAANPAVVLGLLAELNQLKTENKRLTGVTALQMVRKFVGGMNQSVVDDLVATGIRAQDAELARVKAECEGLRVALTECSDSLHGEMLQKFGGQLPDDMHPVTRRDYDRDMAEVAGYRTEIGGIEPALDTPDELAGLRLDAGRYRWLRVKQTFIWLIQDWFPSDAVFTDVDAEIDAAMGRGEQS